VQEYFLGVDGGQSSTTALVGDETGRVIGYGRGGPCNHVSGPEARIRFIGAISGAVATACVQAGLSDTHRQFTAACFGFSGGTEDKQKLIEEMFAIQRLVMTTDALVALTGATAGAPGIIVISGTGSIALGRNATDRVARAGGWGYVFGDEGGGFDLARQALRAALRMEEGWGSSTTLRARFLDATGARDANDLLHRFYTPEFPRPRIAGYARLVSEAAEEGDSVARELISTAAQQLASLVAAVRRQLFIDSEIALVSPIGGVFQNRALLERFRMLVELEEGNRMQSPASGPAAGALLEAYRAARLEVALRDVPETEK
jgi:N-acetylglucosamine kinase-like BadF-type ATPase